MVPALPQGILCYRSGSPDIIPTLQGQLLMGGAMGTLGFATATKVKLGYTIHPSDSSVRNLSCRHNHTQER